MRIEIEYKGSYAICKVDGKYFQQCDSLTKAMVLSAFSCIEQDFRRNARIEDIINKGESV